ncbi:1-deoxy-D-xylulose-5-phosphate reductoisomerase [Pseudodesulfovibrio indicus]|uniref:1-deoxy-D-xylulose 5-phosphate reductoisomerase n=1 Tax=Pseudodesulfovibrio indicus TaxID=1716143 RepID=A0A126QQ45_9BACT|nr:1-deoxy-D-xylulose-5-phosphate reductoisomerase [Pseudodesulfovibrio indicus]AMK12200.1 1-deoxy-D-xylulose 5-phosphate reductoisomerase [Pseudodesulfovibrio indicus]TDT86601.1 1-deoxy-D-xylulose 5-phosphate reductoisomerase [Pseudodesulfovibrio indicus]
MQSYISPWPETVECPPFPRALSILGATGSIGDSALKVVAKHPDRFTVIALAGGRNGKKLAALCNRFQPRYAAVLDEAARDAFLAHVDDAGRTELLVGPDAFVRLAALPEADLILSSIVGAAGFEPTLAAARAGKMIALANKESLVLGGHLIRAACAESGAVVLPVDSEHNALFQGLAGHGSDEELKRLILTASGGPFRGRDAAFLSTVTRDQALAHPNWDMGAKISIDSATLMNKGLELIEACHLYGLPPDMVSVVVHPQSIIHSLVEYVDGSQLAHLGNPDMQVPIAHCLCYPERVAVDVPRLDLAKVGSLTFEEPDLAAFPCLRLAREAFDAGPSHPIVLNAVNEVAVDAFLKERIGFLDIPAMIEAGLDRHAPVDVTTPEAVLALDREVRRETESRL